MGPKLNAGSDFAKPGRFTGIGRLEDAIALLEGSAGTRIVD
jgi:carbamate kinase